MTAKELCRCTIISFLFLDILVTSFSYFALSFMIQALKCLIMFLCSFMYEVIKSWWEVLCAWALLWGDSVSHFLESPQVLLSIIFFPLGLFSFPRGKFSSVLPVGSMPGYRVSGNLKNKNNFENIVLSCIGSGWVSVLLIVWLIMC